MSAAAVTVDRDVLERFLVDVDALATVEFLRCGGNETPLMQHINRIVEQFELATLGDDDRVLTGADDRGREVFRTTTLDLLAHA